MTFKHTHKKTLTHTDVSIIPVVIITDLNKALYKNQNQNNIIWCRGTSEHFFLSIFLQIS